MLKYLILVIFFLPLLLILTPFIIFMYFFPNLFSLRFRYLFLKAILKVLAFVNRAKFIIEGEENLQSEHNICITPNHQSFYDALALITILKKNSTFVAKIETKKMPYIGMFVKIIDGFFLDRQNIRAQVKTMKDVENKLKSEDAPNIIIFPEGTRTRDENFNLLEFKAGSFKPCYNSKATIVPCVLNGSYNFLSKKWFFRHQINIKFLPKLEYEDYKDIPTVELCKKVQNEIQEELNIIRSKTKA